MKKLTLLIVFTCLASAPLAFAQTVAYKPPVNYTLQRPDDYDDYTPDVIRTVDWLEATPINKEPEKRREATRFLFQWISGAPDVSVQLQKYVADLTAQEPELLMLFMGGWARYQLQHPEVKDAVTLNIEGLRTLLRAYRGGGIRKNKQLEELVKLDAAGTLPAWVQKQLAE